MTVHENESFTGTRAHCCACEMFVTRDAHWHYEPGKEWLACKKKICLVWHGMQIATAGMYLFPQHFSVFKV